MNTIANCLGVITLYYNLLVCVVLAIVFFWFFYIVDKKKVYTKPWVFLFLAGFTYLVEEIFILLRVHGVLYTPIYLDGFFGIAVVTCFIYMLLLQKEHVEELKHKK